MSSVDQTNAEPEQVSKPTRLLLRPKGMKEFAIYASEASLNRKAILHHDGRCYIFRGEDMLPTLGWVRVYVEAAVVDVA